MNQNYDPLSEKSIYLIQNKPEDSEVCMRFLGEHAAEYKLIAFSSIEDALNSLVSATIYPEHILIDLNDSGRKAADFMRVLRNEHGHIFESVEITILSDSTLIPEKPDFKEFTVVNHVVKPLSVRVLNSILTRPENMPQLSL